MNRTERRNLLRQRRRAARQGSAAAGTAGTNGAEDAELARALGEAIFHLEAGRPKDAARLCRRLLKVWPGDAEALNLAGIAEFQSGDARRAVKLLGTAIARQPGHVDAHINLGNVLKAIGDYAEAKIAYRGAIKIAPDNADAHFNLGLVLEASDRPGSAIGAFESALAARPDFAEAHFSRANALKAVGRLQEAEAAYRRTVELAPKHDGARTNLGAVLRELGRPAEAETIYREALALASRNADLHYNLGIALQDQERLADAEACYRRVLELAPDYVAALVNLGYVLQTRGRLADAVAAYRRAAALAPDYAGAHVNLADACLEAGDTGAALDVCQEFLAAHPGDTALLAFKAVVLNERGDGAAVRAIIDFEHLLRPVQFTTAPGFADIAELNQALARHVRAHPSLVAAPASHATRDGRHSGELLIEPKGPVAALEAMIHDSVGAYMESLEVEPGHPFAAARPGRYELSVWGVVLTGPGHQLPHIHPAAWLSGVYYPLVPATVEAEGQGEAGWIEFGRPPDHFHCTARPTVKAYRPEEGLMVLFPSYFYHRTVPFTGTDERVSIAFDVRPLERIRIDPSTR